MDAFNDFDGFNVERAASDQLIDATHTDGCFHSDQRNTGLASKHLGLFDIDIVRKNRGGVQSSSAAFISAAAQRVLKGTDTAPAHAIA